MPHLDAAFAPLLGDRLDSAEESSDTVIGTWPDGTIAYLNPAYFRFSRDNGGPSDFAHRWGLGAQLLDSIPEVLRDRYVAGLDDARRATRYWETGYRCPTPTHQQRFKLRIYPLDGGAGLLHVHSMFWTGPHEAAPGVGEQVYRMSTGMIRQCADCRHVFRPGPDRWEMVASFLTDPPANVSHGLCPSCLPTWTT